MSLSISPAREKINDLLLCLSVGNLIFIQRWYFLQHLRDRSSDYFRSGPPDSALLYSTLIAAGLLAVVFFVVGSLIRLTNNRFLRLLGRIGILLVLMAPIETVRRYWNPQTAPVDLGSNAILLAIELLLAFGAFAAAFGKLRIYNVAKRVAVTMVVMIPIYLIDLTFLSDTPERASAYAPRPALSPLSPRQPIHGVRPPRVIWMLFDEFDQRLAFDERPSDLKLPEIDRLRAESLTANRVSQTASWTILAIPSLISGKLFDGAAANDATTLLVSMPGLAKPLSWRDTPNVFQRARKLGANAAIVGWHHPYCRVFGDAVVRCTQVAGSGTDSLSREMFAEEHGVWESVGLAYRMRWEAFLDTFRAVRKEPHYLDRFLQARQQKQYFQIRDEGYKQAADPSMDFVFIHFPTPHLFAIYDRKNNAFSLSDKTTYFDNLALVDRTVGEMRTVLEHAGLWDSTGLIVSSDHGLRYDLWHGGLNWNSQFDRLLENGPNPIVPFIVKFPGKNVPASYDRRFSAVITGDLALAMLRGEISTPSEGAAWLARHDDVEMTSTSGQGTQQGNAAPMIHTVGD